MSSTKRRWVVAALSAVAVLMLVVFAGVVLTDRILVNELAVKLTELNKKRDQIVALKGKLADEMHQQGLGDMKGRELTEVEHKWISAVADEVIVSWDIKAIQEEILSLEKRPWVSAPACYWGQVM